VSEPRSRASGPRAASRSLTFQENPTKDFWWSTHRSRDTPAERPGRCDGRVDRVPPGPLRSDPPRRIEPDWDPPLRRMGGLPSPPGSASADPRDCSTSADSPRRRGRVSSPERASARGALRRSDGERRPPGFGPGRTPVGFLRGWRRRHRDSVPPVPGGAGTRARWKRREVAESSAPLRGPSRRTRPHLRCFGTGRRGGSRSPELRLRATVLRRVRLAASRGESAPRRPGGRPSGALRRDVTLPSGTVSTGPLFCSRG
jgi:hypothetical protein